jgi:GH15 family glucan-1,4-alpha-glucosidase
MSTGATASHAVPIADLGFISDGQTGALVDRSGSVVWYSPEEFVAPSVFGSLLDGNAGYWRIAPDGDASATRDYETDSLVLRTTFQSAEGAVTVTDLLALDARSRGHDLGRQVPHVLVRIVEGLHGRVPITMTFAPRFEYGVTVPWLTGGGRHVGARAGPSALRLDAATELEVGHDAVTAHFAVEPEDRLAFVLSWWDQLRAEEPPQPDGLALRETTLAAWRSWTGAHARYEGEAADLVARSAMILQGLTDGRTGAVLAAATTSLPEAIGGAANWDYRFVWLRDLAFVMRALWVAACPDEADRFLTFLADALGRLDGAQVPIMLRSDGGRDISEHVLSHLRGYAGSRPVRVGNDAWRQHQLDVYGEVLDSAHLLRDSVTPFQPRIRELLRSFADRAASDWRRDDAGMWEARDADRPYTSSKVMCWVALDRAIALHTLLGDGREVDVWRRERAAVGDAIRAEAWSERIGAFAGAFGSDELDASVLLMPLVGFVPATDPRMAATIRAVAERLTSGPLVHRWDGDANGFLICSYWLAECEALLGDVDAARRRFAALNTLANDLGLLSEMAEPGSGRLIGNMPQAFSHVGLINASWRLTTRN